ncbi:MAG: c-type cytochrome [Thermoleophilia bacterium]
MSTVQKPPTGRKPRTNANQESFARYKADVKKEGKPFFPYAMFHDTVMALVVVGVIIGLACVWYFTSGEEAGDAGILGPRYTAEADPGSTSFTPRPDWYFFFLFYLLRIFKWPESVILGTIGIPTIALILLLVVPFIDRRRERRLLRRPVAVVASLLVIASMGILTYKGATAKEGGTAGGEVAAQWIERNNLVVNAQGLPDLPSGVDAEAAVTAGAELFGVAGCLNCHLYLGAGAQNLGAPELTEEGTKGRGIQWQIDHLKNPSALTPGSAMPSFASLTDEQLTNLAVFLEASKGEGGG